MITTETAGAIVAVRGAPCHLDQLYTYVEEETECTVAIMRCADTYQAIRTQGNGFVDSTQYCSKAGLVRALKEGLIVWLPTILEMGEPPQPGIGICEGCGRVRHPATRLDGGWYCQCWPKDF